MKEKVWAAGFLCAAVASTASAYPTAAPEGVTVQLQGEASLTVPNDEAVVVFSAEAQRPLAEEASDTVVKQANLATEALKAFGLAVTVQTQDLSTWPVYTRAKEGKVPEPGAWAAKETVRVTVKDVTRISDVMAAAAQHMNFDGVTFSVSKKARLEQNDALIRAAVADAGRKAEVVAQSMGLTAKHVRVESMNIGQRSGPNVRYYAAPAMKSADAVNAARVTPQMSAGTSDVSLYVTMQVKITP